MKELRNTKHIRHTEKKYLNGRSKSFISNTLNGNIKEIKGDWQKGFSKNHLHAVWKRLTLDTQKD